MFAQCVAAMILATAPASGAQDSVGPTTRLDSVAAALAPGHFVRLETKLPPGENSLRDFLRVTFPDGSRRPIHHWSDTGYWDPVRQDLYYLGMWRFKKFIAYSARLNAWRELGWEGEAPTTDERVGHAYGRNALDRKRGHFYHLALVDRHARGLFRYLIDAERWERLPDLPSAGYPSVAALSIEWHPTLDVLVVLDPSRSGHRLWLFDGTRWKEKPRSTVDGYHSHLQYNDVSGDVLMAGGNRSPTAVQILDREGKLQTLPEAPFRMSIGINDLTYDPQSGHYLYIRSREKEIWELDPKTLEWQRSASAANVDWPTRSGDLGVPIPIESLGIIFLLTDSGPYLYRHDPDICRRSSCPRTTE